MILSGEVAAAAVYEKIRQTLSSLKDRSKATGGSSLVPSLALILVGENPASQSYVAMKRRACVAHGIESLFYSLPETTSEKALLAFIQELNQNPAIDGILVQLPLPSSIRPFKVFETISPDKDVDGLHPMNMGKLLLGSEGGFIPCTPLGIKSLLDHYAISVTRQNVVIVGRSTIVGKPLAALLMQQHPDCNATVTPVHSQTPHLHEHTKRADVLIVAMGVPNFIGAEMVKEGAVVIDVGINRQYDPSHRLGYRLVGDVDFAAVRTKCRAITPVPKGVGPMTVAMLLHNTLLSFQKRCSSL